MNILVLADSRGMWPREHNWPGVLAQRLGPEHSVNAYVSGVNCWLGDLHMMEEFMLKNFPNQHFDLLIHQGGWHEGGPCFWPAETWASITNTAFRTFNSGALTHPIVSGRDGKNKNLYMDRESEKDVFRVFKEHATRVLCIGLGALRSPNDLDGEYHLGMGHHYEMLNTNDTFLSYGHDELNMPMDTHWIDNYTLNDRIHYNAAGSEQVIQYLHRYILRMNLTLNDALACSNTHAALREKVYKVGSALSKKTKINDVVLIHKEHVDADLLFLSCMVYGRVPLIADASHGNKVNVKLIFDKSAVVEESAEVILPTTRAVNDIAYLQVLENEGKVLSVRHKDVIENAIEYGTLLRLNSQKRLVSWLGLDTPTGLLASVFLPVVFGCQYKRLKHVEGLEKDETFASLKETGDFGATHVWASGPQIAYWTRSITNDQLGNIDLGSVAYLMQVGDQLPADLYKGFVDKFAACKLVNVMTSTFDVPGNVFVVAHAPDIKYVSRDGQEYVSRGRPIPGVSAMIFNDRDEDVTEEKQVGRIVIRTGTLLSGLKRGKFGYYDTGKKGFMEKGEIFVV